ncbi:hypothetical protein [Acinetobacter guillouiae]|uniref:Uncharacterized protein n=1 Tax=Acinetobacter guillouiae NIPH 991 TaxID=1217656 RepID=N8Y1B8_ACIGI|nr:hypothetical protein [Acinetobacter guillouiae]ENV15114.1 hypothetical protein F964_03836 [Acinetobacter guillouiae NIPH 991]
MDVAMLGGGTGRTPTHEQKQSTALFAAQGLASPTKSEASPTQSNLNFKCKAWHCELDLHTAISMR